MPWGASHRQNGLVFPAETVMSDDKSKRAPADRSKISLSDDLRSALLDERPRDKQELTAAVQAVGNSSERVKQYLKKR